MATAKQIAWRKKFAAMAKAGTLKKKRKANPAKKTAAKKTVKRKAPVKKITVSAPSRATGRKPTARLKARRSANTKPGVYPNPSARAFNTSARKSPSHPVYEMNDNGTVKRLLCCFTNAKDAKEYAKAWSAANQKPAAYEKK